MNPVWPYESVEKRSPRFEEYLELMSQPSPRLSAIESGRGGPGHASDGQRRQYADVVQHAAGQHHRAKTRQIPSCAEQPCVTGDTAHPPGRRIMDRAPQHRGPRATTRPAKRPTGLGRGDLRRLTTRWQEAGFTHAEWTQQPVFDKLLERYATNPGDDLRQHDEVDIAVDEPSAWRLDRTLIDRQGDRGLVPLELLLERKIWPQTRQMGQEMLDRDPVLPVAVEAWEVAHHGISKTDQSIFHQHHHSRSGRNDFCQRGQIKNGIFGHQLGHWVDNTLPERLVIHRLTLVPHQHDCTGEIAVADGRFDQLADSVKPFRVRPGQQLREFGMAKPLSAAVSAFEAAKHRAGGARTQARRKRNR